MEYKASVLAVGFRTEKVQIYHPVGRFSTERAIDQNQEARIFPRKRVLKEGKIVLQPPSGTVDILIRDVGSEGVKFEISALTKLPEKFDLIMVSEKVITPVEIRWRRGNFVGVQFCGPSKPIGLRKI